MSSYPQDWVRDFSIWISQGKLIVHKEICNEQLKKAIGYELIPFTSNISIQNQLTKSVIQSWKYVLDEMFNIVDFGAEGYVKFDDFVRAIEHIELNLTPEEFDFIVY